MFNIKVNIIVAGAAFIISFLLGIITATPVPIIFIRPFIFAVVFFALFAMIQILTKRFLPELFEKSGKEEKNDLFMGSRIDISEGEPMTSPQDYTEVTNPTSKPAQNIVGARPSESEREMGDISDLNSFVRRENKEPKTVIDQTDEIDYTDSGEVENDSMGEQKEPDTLPDTMPEPLAEFVPEPVPLESFTISKPEEKKDAKSDEISDFVFTNPAGVSASEEALPDLDSMAGAFSSASSYEESEDKEFSVSISIDKTPAKQGQTDWAGEFPPKDMAMGIRTKMNKDKEA